MDISNKSALLVAVFINFCAIGLEAIGIKVAGLPLLLFSIIGIFLVFVKNRLDSKEKVKDSSASINKTTIKSLLDDTYSLYNNTGLFIQYCYTDSVKISGGKRADLDKEFKNYLKVFKGKMLDFPQELEPKILRFYNSLLDYIKRGEFIISIPKTQECYSQQQKLEQDFSKDAPVLYSEIEVELRKLLNKIT